MKVFDANDVIVLNQDLPEHGLAKGMLGAVLERFSRPTLAYEVEFVAADGRTASQCTLKPEQLSEHHSA